MRKAIREKLQRKGLALGVEPQPPFGTLDAGFADTCVTQLMKGEFRSVGDVAKMFGMSADWALKNFFKPGTPGIFRLGKSLLIPDEALKVRIRSLLGL